MIFAQNIAVVVSIGFSVQHLIYACLYKEKIGFIVLPLAWDQIVIQFVKWGIIIDFTYNFAAVVVKQFFIYLKLSRLYLAIYLRYLLHLFFGLFSIITFNQM